MNQTRWRMVGSIAGGIFIALVLFLFMNTLITGGRGQQGAATAGQIVDLIRVQEDEVIQTKKRVRPKKPPPPKDPPPPPKLKVSNEEKPQKNPMRLDLPRIDVSGAAGAAVPSSAVGARAIRRPRAMQYRSCASTRSGPARR